MKVHELIHELYAQDSQREAMFKDQNGNVFQIRDVVKCTDSYTVTLTGVSNEAPTKESG